MKGWGCPGWRGAQAALVLRGLPSLGAITPPEGNATRGCSSLLTTCVPSRSPAQFSAGWLGGAAARQRMLCLLCTWMTAEDRCGFYR